MALFKSPVGNKAARNSGRIWPVPWVDANPYGKSYTLGGRRALHTGADLNLPGMDLGEDVYSIGPGLVTHAKEIAGSSSWGNVIIIFHGQVDGLPLYSRYAHLQAIEDGIREGVEVTADTLIGYVGAGPAAARMDPHLHFDISRTDKLKNTPGDWPWDDRARLETDYVDPKDWLSRPHVITKDARGNPVSGGAQPVAATNPTWYVIAANGTEIREDYLQRPQTPVVMHRKMFFTTQVNAQPQLHEGCLWVQICDGPLTGKWVKYKKADGSEVYLSNEKPSA